MVLKSWFSIIGKVSFVITKYHDLRFVHEVDTAAQQSVEVPLY